MEFTHPKQDKRKKKKEKSSSHRIKPKQETTYFWSQGILEIK
jgi:hypothetical protein